MDFEITGVDCIYLNILYHLFFTPYFIYFIYFIYTMFKEGNTISYIS